MKRTNGWVSYLAADPGLQNLPGGIVAWSKKLANAQNAARRRAKDQALRDLGMVKVRGNLGGTYWE